MRRTSNPKWISNGNSLVGISMGSEFCAEHEWGVKDLKHYFKTDESKDGIDRRVVRDLPKFLSYVERKDLDAIVCDRPWSDDLKPDRWVDHAELKRYEKDLVCAWDERSFAVVAYGNTDRTKLKQLWAAFQRKDIAFWPNIGVFHNGGGLILAIVSQVPAVDKKAMLDSDIDYKELTAAAKATGIEKRLRDSGKNWFALSPRWKNKSDKSAYEVTFWLNPTEQDRNNYGQFTVEDLRLWIDNKGPIPMKNPRH